MKVAQSYLTLQPHGLYSPWNSPGKNTGVGSLSLLQGIFPIQGSNLDLPHCRRIPYQLSHKGSPRILEWVAYPFSSGSSRPRNQTGVSCIAGRFFTNWGIREAQVSWWGEKFFSLKMLFSHMCCAVLSCSVVSDPLQLYTAHQAPLSIGILQARILEWVAMIPSRGSSQPRNFHI